MRFNDVQDPLVRLLERADPNGVITLDGPEPGPTVGVSALTHGNEVSGVLTVSEVLAQIDNGLLRPAAGKLQILLANYEILREASGFEELTRHRGLDLNRIWGEHDLALPAGQPGSGEYGVRDRLLPMVKQADILIDLHSTSQPSTPIGIMLTANRVIQNQVCRVLGVPYVLTNINTFTNGTPMIARHHEHATAQTDWNGYSLVIESGQHLDFSTVQNNIDNVIALLQLSGVLEGEPRTADPAPEMLDLYHVGIAENSGQVIEWLYTENPKGFDRVDAGTPVCRLHGRTIHAEHPTYVVMPQLQAMNAGQELFYLARPA